MIGLIRLAVLAVVAYLAVLAETAAADLLEIGTVAPAIVALAALVWTLTAPGRYAFLEAGAIALAGDLVAPGRVGAGGLWMLPVAYAIQRSGARLRLNHPAAQFLLVLAGASVWLAAVGLTRGLLGESTPGAAVLAQRALCAGAYTAAVALPLLLILGWTREGRKGKADEWMRARRSAISH